MKDLLFWWWLDGVVVVMCPRCCQTVPAIVTGGCGLSHTARPKTGHTSNWSQHGLQSARGIFWWRWHESGHYLATKHHVNTHHCRKTSQRLSKTTPVEWGVQRCHHQQIMSSSSSQRHYCWSAATHQDTPHTISHPWDPTQPLLNYNAVLLMESCLMR